MLIQLNIAGNGASARVYARAAHREPGFQVGTVEWRAAQFCHSSRARGMCELHWAQVENHENDLFVNFESKVPFARLCKSFELSAFNRPAHYEPFQHNCAHSALFVLQLAGIPLQYPMFLFGKPLRGSWLPLPSVLTPMGLYRMAQTWKLKEIQAQRPERHPLVMADRAWRQKQCFFASQPELRNALVPVFNATKTALQQHPCQPEFYLRALLTSLQLAVCPSQDALVRYRALADSFQSREASWRDREAYRMMHVCEVYVLALVLLGVSGMMSFGLFLTLTITVGSCTLLRLGAEVPEGSQRRPLVPTPLSRAMIGFVDTLAPEGDAHEHSQGGQDGQCPTVHTLSPT